MIDLIGGNIVPVLAISLTFLFMVIWVVAETITSVYKTRCNTRLKEQLIERKIPSSEIDRIIQAGTKENSSYVQPVPPVKVSHS